MYSSDRQYKWQVAYLIEQYAASSLILLLELCSVCMRAYVCPSDSDYPPHTCSFSMNLGFYWQLLECNRSRYLAKPRVQKCRHWDRDSLLLKDTSDACQPRAPDSVPLVFLPVLIPTSSSLPRSPFLFVGFSSYSSCFRTPPPPIQTAPPLPLLPLTTTGAKKGKRGKTKRRKTRKRKKGNESTSPPKPVTAQIQIECLEMTD